MLMSRFLYSTMSKGYADAVARRVKQLPPTQRALLLKGTPRRANLFDWRVVASTLPAILTWGFPIAIVTHEARTGERGSMAVVAMIGIVVVAGQAVSYWLQWHFKRLAKLRYLSRMFPSLCTNCGYDLQRNTSGTCPECGTHIPKKPEAVA